MDTTRLMLPLGHTDSGAPVYPVWGAAGLAVGPDSDADPDADQDEEPDEPDEGAQPDEGGKKGKSKQNERYVPPSESEWARVRSSLDKANGSAKEKRLALAAAQQRIRELEDATAARDAAEERRKLLESRQPAPAPAETGGKRGRSATPAAQPPADLPEGVLTPAQVRQQLAQAKRAEREAVQAEYLDMARRSAARVALSEAQVPKASLGRLLRLIDLEEIELDQDGEVTAGLEEQIEQLKAELPQLFAAPEPDKPRRQRPRVPNAGAAPQPPAREEPKSSAERMAQEILGTR